jgi:oligopeptide/dipeptide ABC transporter ATP-binding protein
VSSLLEVRAVSKDFGARGGGVVRVLDGVDLDLAAGETLGLVGESGAGKTVLGRCVLRIVEPTSGAVRFRGEDLLRLGARELRRRRRHFQMIFQDPYDSLDPRMRVGAIVGEPLIVHRIVANGQRVAEVERLLAEVGLPPETAARFPDSLSGGQRQRLAIARALASRPELIIADEPLSALDASIQTQVVDLLVDLGRARSLAMILVAHDLAVVGWACHRVAVMLLGKLVEIGRPREVFGSPRHPYTAALVAAAGRAGRSAGRWRLELRGESPSPRSRPAGCAFHPRCPIAEPRCRRERPSLTEVDNASAVACHRPGELAPDDFLALQNGTF